MTEAELQNNVIVPRLLSSRLVVGMEVVPYSKEVHRDIMEDRFRPKGTHFHWTFWPIICCTVRVPLNSGHNLRLRSCTPAARLVD